MGATERSIAKQTIRSGEPLPDRIKNAPKLRTGLSFYLNAFFDLDTARSIGLELGPIPFPAIVEYAKFYELDEEQTDSLVYFIRAMDTAHLKHEREKK